MKRYLAQLLADMETATRHAPGPSSYAFRSPFSEEEEEQRIDGVHTRYVRLCELFGLAPDAFPPVERLTKTQVTELLTAMETLWRAWRISWECPSKLSARRRYTLMVDWMYHELVRYHHDFGAEVDFCCYRQQGICPFGENGGCHCQETEDIARRDVETWEEFHRDQQVSPRVSPVEEFYDWLRQDEPSEYEWDYDEDRDRWRQFANDEDANAWLYFYRPEVNAELQGDEQEPAPDEFDDFDWDSRDDYDDISLPF